jgi:hypothetical protein
LLLVVPIVELAVDDGHEQRVLPDVPVAVVVFQSLSTEMTSVWNKYALRLT